ncbi:NADPH--cytochrome P450 reductase [Yarrowia sp. C11]|nr:NADPH--cytochrome P450 reductase [Yarrowia sp. E02]KAG5369179.1 NADPH--cytochrome P450 reductase [Yarrowia sp. C11]
MALLDSLDFIVLVLVGVATLAFFTKGKLWAKEPETDPYAGGLGSQGFGSTTSFGSFGGNSNKTRDITKKLEQTGKNVIIFYGSQTGTAEDYANRLSKEATQRYGLKSMTADLEDYDYENLNALGDDIVVGFVMATYGEGEPTDNAVNFYEFINDDSAEWAESDEPSADPDSPLSSLNYVIFGLGNNTYEHYNEIGRNLDKRLKKLGAKRIGDYGEGDDGQGTMEEDYLAWKDDLFSAWKEAKGLDEHEAKYEPSVKISETGETASSEDSSTVAEPDAEAMSVYLGEPNKKILRGEIKGPYNAGNPFLANVSETRELFHDPKRSCIHVEFDVGTNVKYTTGDHLALHIQNSDEEVERFLKVIGLWSKRYNVIKAKPIDPTYKPSFPVPTTYDTVVRYYLEINGAVSRQLLAFIAPFAPTEAAKKEALRLGSDKNAFADEVAKHYTNIAHVLSKLSGGEPWTNVPFSFLVESLPHLIPRYYSISSSSLVDKSKISITAVVESLEAPEYAIKGVATNLLLDMKIKKDGADPSKAKDPQAVHYELSGPRGKFEGKKLPVHIRRSNFKLPSDPKKPIIMIGPGTGLAPFRAFVMERAKQAENGTDVGHQLLFFGCRNPNEDFIYKEQWAGIEKDLGDKFTMVTAFSRLDPVKKVYVQHRMQEHAKQINDLMQQGAYFYVCGDASRMAREVQATLAKILSDERGIPLSSAEQLVKSLKVQNVYQEDVW